MKILPMGLVVLVCLGGASASMTTTACSSSSSSSGGSSGGGEDAATGDSATADSGSNVDAGNACTPPAGTYTLSYMANVSNDVGCPPAPANSMLTYGSSNNPFSSCTCTPPTVTCMSSVIDDAGLPITTTTTYIFQGGGGSFSGTQTLGSTVETCHYTFTATM